ncbi:carnitine dehydratase (plasmid) [Mycobacterium dioxanotrophicus]|uniref:Carnitine dehydratase n=1 Tax=Mycobacterium dioxanotrophicus TaxID=482462 RepID=A0A1Y0CG65_9MYCO|nr:CoA transferase [Mycobacterium dioxanotrophicus]ART74278.1 carnitine dehydratase [Mycobacterium dioxanotrophicus]
MTLSAGDRIGWAGDRVGSLSGVRVLDLSRILAGPYLTMLLGDLGADVIKVERAGGDDTRAWGPPFAQGEATYFWSANRNKRSVVLDLHDSGDAAFAAELAASADIVVENFRPGVAERMGLGYQHVSAINPRVIYCSISAFGDSESARDLAGYDLLVQAVGGLMSITGTADGGPVKVGVALVDVLAALHAAVGVLAALRHREATGVGQRVDVTMLQTLLASLANQATAYLGTGDSPGRMGNQHPSIAPYQTLSACDGQIALACGNDRQFGNLCAALGIAELSDDPRFVTNSERVSHRRDLIPLLEAVTATLPADELLSRMREAGVPAGPVNSIGEAFALAEQLGLEPKRIVVDGERSIPQVSSPLRLSATPVRYDLPPPPLPGQCAVQRGQGK